MKPVLVIVMAGFLAAPGFAQETAAVAVSEADIIATPTEPAAPSEAAEMPAAAIEVLDAAELSLDAFHWVKRPIVIFADSPADPRFQEQVKLLMQRPEELLERDVVLITDTDPSAGSEIRKKLRPRGFMLTLIGKDGGVKLRKPFPWDVREITQTIDKWPLRKQEIRDAKAEAEAAAKAAAQTAR